MDYINVPTTVFTPLEYGCVGYTEEDAIKQFGDENIEVYHTEFRPLEWMFNKARPEFSCYVKLICLKSENEKVIGFHILCDNAGEITQGFTIAIKMGATKEVWDNSVGIHPTIAEDCIGLKFTKRDNPDATKGSC